MTSLFQTALQIYIVLVIVYFMAVNLTYLTFLLVAYREIVHYLRHNLFSNYRLLVQSELTPPVSILAPAYNEAGTVVESTKSLLKLNYGKYEVIVINDGSKDNTLGRLAEEFRMFRSRRIYQPHIRAKSVRGIYRSRQPEYRNLIVVDKENGGKADALNAGVNVASYEYVCCIDADSLLEVDALQKVVKPFLEDERVIAVGGIVRIVNGCKVVNGRVVDVGLSKHLLPVFQVVEYFRAFLSGRMFWHGFNGLLIISGAFGMFKRAAVIEAGGYRHDSIGEDMELVTRLHRMKREKKEPYRISFVPDPVCWTEAPESVGALAGQRNRWHRGLLDTLLLHKIMILNPRYGIVGLAALPYFTAAELFGPVIEFFGYVVMAVMFALGILDPEMAILFFIVAVFYGMMYSVGAVLLEEISFRRYPRVRDLAILIAVGVLENFGYRQMTIWWRVKAFWDYFRGKKTWGVMQRRGFDAAKA